MFRYPLAPGMGSLCSIPPIRQFVALVPLSQIAIAVQQPIRWQVVTNSDGLGTLGLRRRARRRGVTISVTPLYPRPHGHGLRVAVSQRLGREC